MEENSNKMVYVVNSDQKGLIVKEHVVRLIA